MQMVCPRCALLALTVIAPLAASMVAAEDEGIRITGTLPGPDGVGACPTFIEGSAGTILMSLSYDGKVQIASSDDEGHSWRVVATVATAETLGGPVGGGYFTRLPDGGLLLRLCQGQRNFWVRSDDVGLTWSEPTPIVAGVYGGEAPIRVMADGRWASTPYRQVGEDEFAALLTWSSDQGRTWSEPIRLPTPEDGNKGLTESDICQLGPSDYVMAIRADEGKQSWDGFYLSWSKDGLQWSTPVSLGERGRMPLFYRVGDLWALCYRRYSPPAQYSAVRFSRDGHEWSEPMLIERGVDAAPFLAQVNGKVLAFNRRYPERTQLTRHDITEGVRAMQEGRPAPKPQTPDAPKPKVIRDILWAWGNPEMGEGGEHSIKTYAQAPPAERARLLGVPNVLMAGLGIPDDQAEARFLTQEVAHAPRIIWEISSDEQPGPPFVYEKRTAQVRELYDEFPNIVGVLLDDMSTAQIDRGFKPEHIRAIRAALGGKYEAIRLWGVVYTMSFDRPNMNDYIKELDGISLWEWDGAKVGDLEKAVAHIEQVAPGKPILLGLYMFDYGGGRLMPLDLMKTQCDIALRLAHEKRIEGIVFLSITNDPEVIGWVAEWVKRVGEEPL
jgi:hypothetical protein